MMIYDIILSPMGDTNIILPYVKNIIQNVIQDDIFIKNGSDIFPASSTVLKTMTFFRNIFNDCQFTLHKSKPLITLEGFHFLNKKNIMCLHSYIRSRMVFEFDAISSPQDKPTVGFEVSTPTISSDQVNFLLLLDYLIGENPAEKVEFIRYIKFVTKFWEKIFEYPRLLQFFTKEQVLGSLHNDYSSSKKLTMNIRKILFETYGMLIYTREELGLRPRYSTNFVYKISNHTLYKIVDVKAQYNYNLVELIEEEKLHSSIKVLIVAASVQFYSENDMPLHTYPDHKITYGQNGLLCSSEHTFIPAKNEKTNLFCTVIQGEEYLLMEKKMGNGRYGYY